MLRLGTTLLALAVMVSACSPPPPPPDGGTGSGAGGGGGGGGSALSQFEVTDLDPTAADGQYFAIAVDPVQERVGVAYYSSRRTMTMQGTPDYDLKYVEWRQGVISPIQTVRYVQRLVGLSLVFDPTNNGEPLIAHLGGDDMFVPGMSIFWFQSNSVLSRRTGGTTWTEIVVATDGNQVTCGNPVSDRGFLVGLWPAMAFDSTNKLYLVYRDPHNGQFPLQDWAGSDVELWEGGVPPTMGSCLAQGGNNKDGYGGHNQIVIGANDQPMVIYDQMLEGADTVPKNVYFQRRNANGTWTPPAALLNVSNTQTGASLAYDPTEGYGIAFVDRANNVLKYSRSMDGSTWLSPDPVFGSGTGGWYPSLAMDPKNHEPAIAFYICSPRTSVNDTSCLTRENKLMVAQRVLGTWRQVVVDENGGHSPKIAFFSAKNGAEPKRVIVYRSPPAIDADTGQTVSGVGALKIAVER